MDESNFIVYTTDTPVYSSEMFGGIYVDSSPCIEKRTSIDGSALILSGGLVRAEGARCEMLPTGLIQVALGSAGKRFGERVVSSLVSPADPVTVFIEAHSLSSLNNWLCAGESAGFQTFQAGWGIICLGRGADLPRLRWLGDTFASYGNSIFVGKRIPCQLQQGIVDRARSGADGLELAREVWNLPRYRPTQIGNTMQGCRLAACLGGLEEQDLVVNLNETDPTGLDDILTKIAEELGVRLYYAGNAAGLKSSGWFGGSEEWQPIPVRWIRRA